MKYSQAVLVACIGGAALVSALPAGPPKAVAPPAKVGNSNAPAVQHGVTQPIHAQKDQKNRTHANKKQQNPIHATSVTGPVASPKPTARPAPQGATSPAAAPAAAAPHTPRELQEELEARLFDSFRQRYRDAKAQRLQNQAVKAQNTVNTYATKQGVQTPPASPAVAKREFEEELEARLFDSFRQRYRDAKAQRLQNQAVKAQNTAHTYAGKTGVTPPNAQPVARDFDDEDVYARDLVDESIEERGIGDVWNAIWHKKQKPVAPTTPVTPGPRDVEDALEMREFDEGVEARSIGDFWNAIWHRKQKPVAPATPATPAAPREFHDEEGLVARGYFDEEALSARNFFDTLSAVTKTFTPSPAGPKEAPAAAPEAPAAAPEAPAEPEAREYFDEFDARDFIEIDELD